jgi:hypothetical protein
MTYDIQYKKDCDIPEEFKDFLIESLKSNENTSIRVFKDGKIMITLIPHYDEDDGFYVLDLYNGEITINTPLQEWGIEWSIDPLENTFNFSDKFIAFIRPWIEEIESIFNNID